MGVAEEDLVGVTLLPLVVVLPHLVRVRANETHELIEHSLDLPFYCIFTLSIVEGNEISSHELVVLEVHFVNVWLVLGVQHILRNYFLEFSHSIGTGQGGPTLVKLIVGHHVDVRLVVFVHSHALTMPSRWPRVSPDPIDEELPRFLIRVEPISYVGVPAD